MNSFFAYLLAYFNFVNILNAYELTDVYCAQKDWKLSGLTPIPRCYQKLPPVFRSNLTAECDAIGGVPINVESFEHGEEVIEMMRSFKYYGIWVDAKDNNGDRQYKWIDDRSAPNPISWCSGAKKTNSNLAIVCPYPNYDNFSMSTCCISDRQDRTKWAAMCQTYARAMCQYSEAKQVNVATGNFVFISSSSAVNSDGFGNEACCQLCTRIENCSLYDFNKETLTCDFYEKKVRIFDVSLAIKRSTSNYIAGAPYIRLDKF